MLQGLRNGPPSETGSSSEYVLESAGFTQKELLLPRRAERIVNFVATTGDQALVSLCNFGVAIIVGRLLGPEAFGLFTLIWSIALLLNVVQQSFIIAPLFTFSAKFPLTERRKYFFRVLALQSLFAGIAFTLVGLSLWTCVTAGLLSPDLRPLIVPIALACLAFQLQNFIRRLLQVARLPVLAFICDLVTYGLQIGLLFRELVAGHSSLAMVFLALGVSWLVGCFFFFAARKCVIFGQAHPVETCRLHLSFGFSVVLADFFQWSASYGTLYMVGAVLSPTAVGNIRAAISIVAPLNVLAVGIQTYLSIEAADVYHTAGISALVGLLRRATLRFLVACTPGVLVCIWSEPLMRLLLGPRYHVPTSWVAELFLVVVLSAVFGMVMVHFKTVERPALSAYASGFGLIIALLGTVLLVFRIGAGAAPAGLLAGQICTLGAACYFWTRSTKDSQLA